MIIIEKEINSNSENLIPENSIFYDIETTGFKRNRDRIYLIGTLAKINGKFILKQYLTESQEEEKILIKKFLEDIEGFETLISFNGEAFDKGFIEERAKKYKIPVDLDKYKSLDIYKIIKSQSYLLEVENFKLKTLERHIGIFREDVFTGGELISIYYEFENGKRDLEKIILLHNEEDILNMPNLFLILEEIEKLNTIKIDSTDLLVKDIKLKKDSLEIAGKSNIKNGYFESYNKRLVIENYEFKFFSIVNRGYYDESRTCVFIEREDMDLIECYEIKTPDGLYLLKFDKDNLYKHIFNYFNESIRSLMGL